MAAEQGSEKVACDMTVTDFRHRPPVGRGRHHCGAADPMQRSTVSLGRGIPENGSDGLGLGADFSYWQCYEDPVFGRQGFREVLPLKGPTFREVRFSEVTVP